MLARPPFDEALAFWRKLLRERELPERQTWVFAEDTRVHQDSGEQRYLLRPRSAGVGEWLARRAYAAAPAGNTLTFAAFASTNGYTIAGLQRDAADERHHARREDWNLAFDATCRLQHAVSIDYAWDAAPAHASYLSEVLLALNPLRERMTAGEHAELRLQALHDLILLASPIASVQHSLADVARQSGDPSILEKQHVLSVLHRFETDELAGREVEAWANAIELRADIVYDRESAVWDVLYELANPTLTEPLTRERADVLASVLKGH